MLFWDILNKATIPLALDAYEKIMANSALQVSLAICNLVFNACLWNNIF